MLRRRTLAAVVIALLACQPTDDLPTNYQPVVITAILVANQPLQMLTVLWAPTQGMRDPTGGPDPTDVNLWIVSSPTDSTPVISEPRPGKFFGGADTETGE